ncbi:MAG: endonuclease/exonuclease/phosphatase family protein [Nitrosomonas sp.]|nr:MAG: endonuclease/exonuclease/phosphatase family protein [Nitrosomonas sp.]
MKNITIFLVVALLTACSSTPFFRAPPPNGEVENETDADLEVYKHPGDAREYYRWPFRRNVMVGNENEFAPDAEGFANAPRPQIFGEEMSADTGVILVGSWNLKGMGANKVQYRMKPVGGQPDNPDRTIARFVAQYIDSMGLHVVALQEVVDGKRFDMDDLKAAMRHFGYELAVGDDEHHTRRMGRDGQTYEYCPIFYNRNIIQLERAIARTKTGVKKMGDINGQARRFTYAYLGVKEGICTEENKRFDFVMTCFHAPPPADGDARERYYRLIPDQAKELTWDPDVILAGDFNGDPDSSVDIERNRWSPVLADEDGARFLRGRQFTHARAGMGTSIFNENIYDKLLWRQPTEEDYAGEMRIEYSFDAYFTDAANNRDTAAQNRISDHRPIWAAFKRCNDSD